MRPVTPTNEAERLAALLSCSVLDTPAEASFDDFARLAGQVCGTPIALVSFVDAERQWFKARVGLELAETPRDVSFCAHALHSPEVLVVPDTRADPRFADNPFVQGDAAIRFYAGAPLVVAPDVAVGTLCVLDRVPRELSPQQVAALASLAQQVTAELALRRKLASMRAASIDPEAARGRRAVEGRLVAGRYRIEGVLGVGGMGIVVAARDEAGDEPVAIKFLGSEVRDDAAAQERFVREARALLAVGSEHVARVLDVGNLASGAPYIVMERLEGEDLHERFARTGPLPVAEAVGYILQACEAIARAHAVGILHRDLKPANLFLTRREDGSTLVKVLDFGVSKFSRDSALADEDDISLTQATALLGSPYYMAPEQVRGERDLDARADLWSLGVILYELLTGALPFERRTLIDLCAAVLTDEAPSVAALRPEVPAALSDAVMRCLSKSRDERFASADALADALRPFADAPPRAVEAPPPPPAVPPPLVAPRPPRRRRAYTALAVLGLAVLLATVWLIMAATPAPR